MWNDKDIPLGYLITFRSYGTWLHGDERGSVNRFRNKFGEPALPKEEKWVEKNKERMKGSLVILDSEQRASTESAIRETCEIRNWGLKAINVRTNHVHVVVSIGEKKSSIALNAFKANATRKMREDGNWKKDGSPWVDRGSERYLWTEESILKAIDYVINGQGADLRGFDNWKLRE